MKKTLCMLLALILVASALPVNLAAAFAEAGIEVETETEGEVLPVENGEEPELVVEEPETDLPGENEPQAQPGEEPSAEPAQEEAVRYARALDALSIYKASDLRERHAVLPKESVVLVLESAETWMRVAVNTQKGVVEGYVAIDAVEVLAGEALERSKNRDLDRSLRDEMHIGTSARLPDSVDSISALFKNRRTNCRFVIEDRVRGEEVDSGRSCFVLTDDNAIPPIILKPSPNRVILRPTVEHHERDLPPPE